MVRERRFGIRVLAQAHRRDRDRLDQPQLRGPVIAGAERLPVRRRADLFDDRAHQGQAARRDRRERNHRAGTSGVLTRNVGVEIEHRSAAGSLARCGSTTASTTMSVRLRKDNRYSVSGGADLQAQSHGAGQRRGSPGMAEVERSRRRLCGARCFCSACGCSTTYAHQLLQHRRNSCAMSGRASA